MEALALAGVSPGTIWLLRGVSGTQEQGRAGVELPVLPTWGRALPEQTAVASTRQLLQRLDCSLCRPLGLRDQDEGKGAFGREPGLHFR